MESKFKSSDESLKDLGIKVPTFACVLTDEQYEELKNYRLTVASFDGKQILEVKDKNGNHKEWIFYVCPNIVGLESK